MSAVSPFKTVGSRPVNGRSSSATLTRLRALARGIRTQEQFEAIVAASSAPARLRAILGPMVRPDLACCLAAVAHPGAHSAECPVTRRDLPPWVPAYLMMDGDHGQ